MRILSILLLVLQILISIPATAQHAGREMVFERIGLDRGLDNNTVIDIGQDGDEAMWFITKSGVNRFNGYAMTHYPIRARSVIRGQDGGVWISAEDGLHHYDAVQDRMECHPFEPVVCAADTRDGKLLVSTESGLVVFDKSTGTFERHDGEAPMYSLAATSILCHDGALFIGTGEGVYTCALNGEGLRRLIDIRADVHRMLVRSQTELWLATEGLGLYRYDLYSGTSVCFRHTGKPGGISSNYVRSLEMDSDGTLWVGTYNGLDILSEDGTFESHQHSPSDEGSLSHNSIRAIYRDSQGGMWLGTYFGGVNYTHQLRNRFVTIHSSTSPNSLSGNVISCIREDSSGYLWIGSNDSGLDRYDPRTGMYSNYRIYSPAADVPFRDVKTIFIRESTGKVYVGAHAGGLMVIDRRTGAQEFLNTSNSGLGNNNVYGIEDAGDDCLWVATLDGLFLFDCRAETFTPVDKDINGINIRRRILGLFRDSAGRLWAFHNNGFSIYERRGRELSHCQLPSNGAELQNAGINNACQTKEGTVWLATDRGLWSVTASGLCSRQEGLPSEVICSVCEDSNGSIWFSTMRGLSHLDPYTGDVRTYSSRDGLARIQFNAGCCFATGDGDLLFGGIGGFVRFDPDGMSDNPFSPKPTIDRLTVGGVEIRPGDGSGLLSSAMSHTDRLVLKPNQNSFTIGFHVKNYVSGTHNTYSYKMDGFDRKWNTHDTDAPAVYTNLPAGRYRFMVRAANNDGIWNDDASVLPITVRNVWYRTWWFLCLFTALLLGLLFGAINVFWGKKSMKAELEREKSDRENQKMMSEMQIRFYINISHELRTPLTLILSPLQDLLNHAKGYWEKDRLNYIKRNTDKLLHLVNQLLDYRRAELGIFALKIEKADAYRRLLTCFENYVGIARRKDMDYNLICDIQDEEEYFDVNYFDIIANNLLSNAFKYTGSGRSITVRLTRSGTDLLLEVADTGIGIEKDKQSRIFERFYQASDSSYGSGIGLSLVKTLVDMHHGTVTVSSEPGKGSTFSVLLPQALSAYSDEEMKKEDSEDSGKHFHSNDVLVIDDVDQSEGGQNPASARMPAGQDGKRGTILLVEDNADLRGYIAGGLSDFFDIVQAEDGSKALEYLKEGNADLIISDVMMPNVNGLQLCRSVKQNSKTSHIPVFLLSAMAEASDQMDGLHVGADDYIPKPFSLDVLKAKALNTLVTQKRNSMRITKKVEVRPEEVAANSRDEELLRHAIEIIEKNIDNPSFSTDELARELCMSRSNLHIKMKAITGRSAMDLIQKVRFGRACQLLSGGEHTVAQISDMVGFSSASYFASRFRKYVGCLPTEYGKQ